MYINQIPHMLSFQGIIQGLDFRDSVSGTHQGLRVYVAEISTFLFVEHRKSIEDVVIMQNALKR